MPEKRKKPKTGVPPASSEAALKRMQAARGQDTKPEKQLRSGLHRLGLRFRVQQRLIKGLRRRADIVFGPTRIVVFIDGCFWHGCPIHGTWPKENAAFWKNKIEANQRRDADTDSRLTGAGWLVIRIWEHEEPLAAALRIAEVVRSRRAAAF
jgi:DNA mismatch endonuclease (patch repair protein)